MAATGVRLLADIQTIQDVIKQQKPIIQKGCQAGNIAPVSAGLNKVRGLVVKLTHYTTLGYQVQSNLAVSLFPHLNI